MKDIIPAKKQSPILGLSGMGGGVGSNLGGSLAADPTYADDVFSTYVYKGNSLVRSINNGIKLGNSNAGNGVEFDGSGDYLSVGSSSDFTMGTGDFTVECFTKVISAGVRGIFQISATAGGLSTSYQTSLGLGWDNNYWQIYGAGTAGGGSTFSISLNTWYHVALVRYSGVTKLYVNGVENASFTDTYNYQGTYLAIGGYYTTSGLLVGGISNFRVVKGTAVYTGNFTPPTKELTSVTNTKLLCCNNSWISTATVTPTAITVNGNPHPSGGPFTATDGEGGMTWIKCRSDAGTNNLIYDTVRGANERLITNSNTDNAGLGSRLTGFNNNGFDLGNDGSVNSSSHTYASWTWRKQKGFFDVVTYTGTGSTRTVAHNLGCIPGCIIIKCTSNAESWIVFHKGVSNSPAEKYLILNSSDAAGTSSSAWNNTAPTSTHFTVSTAGQSNDNGRTYVAYVFAGGSSTAAGAHSISFPSPAGDPRRILCGNASNTTADFNFGTGDLTIECWIKCNATQGGYPRVVAIGPQWQAEMAALQWDHTENANRVTFYCYNHSSSTTAPLLKSSIKRFNNDGQWHHCAVTRSGNTWRLFVDGILENEATWSGSTNTANSYCTIGNTPGTATTAWFGGYISNVRVVKGTAVYTSSFRPPTEPLKNITNTKLLCCNNLSATAATVTPITLTETNVSQNQTLNPFDDLEGFKFGEEGDQNMIKCGTYVGNGSSNGPNINLDWEPQWILLKSANTTGSWRLCDTMRGIVTGGDDAYLGPSESSAEFFVDGISVNPKGFKIDSSASNWNANNDLITYVAIRRPDGYVGKPPEAGTDVFSMTKGKGGSSAPNYEGGNVVDFQLTKDIDSANDIYAGARLIGPKYLITSSTAQTGDSSTWVYDYMNGYNTGSSGSDWQSWQWKRHAGFDVVTYVGKSPETVFAHSLNKVPEMIWVKGRDVTGSWQVYHNAFNGGTNPWYYFLELNRNYTQDNGSRWDNTAPTSTHFSLGAVDTVNGSLSNNYDYVAMLFASIDGISKVGSYSGTGNAISVTTGFAPRFVIIKNITETNGWFVLDTTRGWGAGDDQYLELQTNSAQFPYDFGSPTSTGFDISAVTNAAHNKAGCEFVYYAHA